MNRGQKNPAVATVNAQLVSSLHQLTVALQAMTVNSNSATAEQQQVGSSSALQPTQTTASSLHQRAMVRSAVSTPRTSTTASAASSAAKNYQQLPESFTEMSQCAFDEEAAVEATTTTTDFAAPSSSPASATTDLLDGEDIFAAAERRLRQKNAGFNHEEESFGMLCEEALKGVSVSQFGGKHPMKVAKRMLTGQEQEQKPIDVDAINFNDEQLDAAIQETYADIEKKQALRLAQREEAIREAEEMKGRAWILDLPEVRQLRKVTKAKHSAERKLEKVRKLKAKLMAEQSK